MLETLHGSASVASVYCLWSLHQTAFFKYLHIVNGRVWRFLIGKIQIKLAKRESQIDTISIYLQPIRFVGISLRPRLGENCVRRIAAASVIWCFFHLKLKTSEQHNEAPETSVDTSSGQKQSESVFSDATGESTFKLCFIHLLAGASSSFYSFSWEVTKH